MHCSFEVFLLCSSIKERKQKQRKENWPSGKPFKLITENSVHYELYKCRNAENTEGEEKPQHDLEML